MKVIKIIRLSRKDVLLTVYFIRARRAKFARSCVFIPVSSSKYLSNQSMRADLFSDQDFTAQKGKDWCVSFFTFIDSILYIILYIFIPFYTISFYTFYTLLYNIILYIFIPFYITSFYTFLYNKSIYVSSPQSWSYMCFIPYVSLYN